MLHIKKTHTNVKKNKKMAGKSCSLNCKMCSKLINPRSSKGLQCYECKYYFHRDCINMTVKSFEEIVRNVDIKWFCEICKETMIVNSDKSPITP